MICSSIAESHPKWILAGNKQHYSKDWKAESEFALLFIALKIGDGGVIEEFFL